MAAADDHAVGVVGVAGGVVAAAVGQRRTSGLTDTAWMCIDFNASHPGDDAAVPRERGAVAAGGLAAEPGAGRCTRRWDEFAKQAFWDLPGGR